MSITSRLKGWMFRLPPAETHHIAVEKNLKIPMPDGVTLLADHYRPRNPGVRPTILIRSVYTDRTKGGWICEIFAERGFHAVVVSCRGTCGSGGELDPFRQEHDDGFAVLSWIKQQDWFNGVLGTYGASYLGYTQWALAADAGSMLKAMSTQIMGSNLWDLVYPGGALSLEVWLNWMAAVHTQEKPLPFRIRNMVADGRRRHKAARHLPLAGLDRMVTGKSFPFWQEWLLHDQPEDKWWEAGNHSHTVSGVAAPNHLVGGWHDFLLLPMLRDYYALKQAGRQPYLTIGPWTHYDKEVSATGIREAVIWLRAHLLGDRSRLREAPVRIFVMGVNEWREYPAWPPDAMKQNRWHLQPEGGLSPAIPPSSEPDPYRYDPGDPTPSVGGARAVGQGHTVQDNRSLEARPDVLTYTSNPLEHDIELSGPVSAELFVRSNLAHTDFFVRLCDIEPSGMSLNVCDGLLRLAPGRPVTEPDGCLKITIELLPTAYRFHRGHRMRIQVSSGSFPRWNRNPGTGEPSATATAIRVAEQHVYHDPLHPSAVILPFLD